METCVRTSRNAACDHAAASKLAAAVGISAAINAHELDSELHATLPPSIMNNPG